MSLSAGTKLGPYEILVPLGAGGMGEVYKARDTRLGREVAVKVILGSLAEDRQRMVRFEREARALAALDHPNILAIHDIGEEGGHAYLVTELLEGETLRERLQKGPLELGSALRIGGQVAEGLAAAHERGVVHRDLKPGNIFITGAGHAKILDFGLARLEAGTGSGERGLSEAPTAEAPTKRGTVLGTPGYMAPEQLRGEATDPRTDVFALGIILYEMLTGARPFKGTSEADALAAVLTAKPQPISAAGKLVPAALEKIVGRCLEKDPARRFQSARDLAFELEEMAGGRSRRIAFPRLRWRPPTGAIAGVGLVLVLGGVLSVWLALQARDSRLPDFVPIQVTSRPDAEEEPCLSPDGQTVAFTLPNGRGSDILVADVRGGTPIRVASDGTANSSPSWYPDGSALAYVSPRNGRPCVWKVPRFGGPPTLVIEDALSPAISLDGQRIAFARSEGGADTRIWVAPLGDPSKAVRVTGDSDGVWEHSHPSWSPDGRLLCYHDKDHVWVVGAGGGGARRLTEGNTRDKNPVWSPDGRHIYFDSLRQSTWAIWRVRYPDGLLQRVTFSTGSERWPSLSQDGRKLAYASTVRSNSFTLLDTVTGERIPVSEGAWIGESAFSPDGNWVAYARWWDMATNIWRVRLRQDRPDGEPQRLTDQQGECSCLAYSPDGRWIAYHRVYKGQRHIWVVPAEGGPPVAFSEGTSKEVQPQWSPDGHNLSFISDRGGHDRVWSAPFSEGRRAGEPRVVADGLGGISMHCWSNDGTRLALLMNDGSGRDIWTLDPTASTEPVRLTRGANPFWLAKDPSSDQLLIVGNWGTAHLEARRMPFSGGPPSPIPRIGAEAQGYALSEVCASPNGRLLALRENQNKGDLWLLQATKGRF